MNSILVPVAQYLRMSTEHQQYSLQNQAERIKQYADEHNFGVIQTYSDAAKSGLVLRSRKGLQQLLKDVVSGAAGYRAILVYDVSRWVVFRIPTRQLTTSSCVDQREFRCTIARKPSPMTEVCRA